MIDHFRINALEIAADVVMLRGDDVQDVQELRGLEQDLQELEQELSPDELFEFLEELECDLSISELIDELSALAEEMSA